MNGGFFVKKIYRILSLALTVCISAVCLAGCDTSAEGKRENDPLEMTTAEVVADMGVGINLGNTFECSGVYYADVTGFETAWGSPVVTREMIQGYKDAGFGVLRVPVAWSNLMNAKTFKLSSEYIARVKEVIGWAIESDMYVIMNIHWDGGWFEKFGEDKYRDWAFEKYESVWTQLSEAFKDFDGKLMFESLNEEGGWDAIWNRYSGEGDREKSYSILNDINQRFVNIVRASGGNNEKRHLLIAGYCTDIELTSDELYKMPDDPQGRCAVSVHYYTPSTFAILTKDADWGKASSTWGTEDDMAELTKYMDMMKTNFIDKGVPVILGEYGCPDERENKEAESVRKYVSSVCEAAYTRGICPVLWDITDHFYDRTACKFRDEELLDGIMAVKEKERSKVAAVQD